MVIKMTKYSFILLSEETESFLKQIQKLGVIDIRRSVKPVDATSSEMLEQSLEAKQVIASLKKINYANDPSYDAIMAAKQKMFLADDPLKRAKELFDKLNSLTAERKSVEMEMKSRLPWGSFDKKSLDGIADQGFDIRFYSVPKKKYDDTWAELYPLQVIKDEEQKIWFVTIAEKGQAYNFPVAELAAPSGSVNESEAELKAIDEETINCKADLLKQKDALPQMEKNYVKELSNLDLYLAEASSEKAAENTLSLIVGFAPTSDDEKLKPELDRLNAACLSEPATVEDNPPIKLKNGWFARMFEVLTGMYGQPVYDEFDPTPILAPFFLLFFAMCMGDAGYGIILFIISFFLKGKQGGLAKSWRLIRALGVGTFVVGIILGTCFGINLYDQTWVPEWLKKCMIVGNIGAYSAQMVLALGIGVFHICLAMIIKAIGFTKRYGIKENISNWGWTLLVVGSVVALAFTIVGFIPEDVTKWIIICIAGISGLGIFIFNKIGRNPLLNIGAGFWDTYQMATGILGDVLSYIRLYALGLAGGMLGAAFNDLGMMVFSGVSVPGLNWLFLIIILLIGHALNLAMSCLGAFVHPLRLTFVEYFKNSGYEGKGVKYKPLQ
jgi:Archaeal/vacuolar-type H+-ATPase subunit I